MKKQAKNTDSSEEWEMASFQDQFITQDLKKNTSKAQNKQYSKTKHYSFQSFKAQFFIN